LNYFSLARIHLDLPEKNHILRLQKLRQTRGGCGIYTASKFIYKLNEKSEEFLHIARGLRRKNTKKLYEI